MTTISNFIRTIMENDLKEGKVNRIATRFPPEPNAYLHIGHVRAIVTNFELAKVFDGTTNLRFDDTNPTKEEQEFVEAIIEDIRWLGYTPNQVLYGSDYFEDQYERAKILINKGLAYVCDLSQDEIAQYRGTLTEGGKNSPYRERTIEENLQLFEEMRQGKYKNGEKVLRAKIDMNSPNINMRDPVLYRILHEYHQHTKDKWCIYPMYDFAHPLQDAIEGITHSLCTVEYEDHRPLYDWVVSQCETPHVPRQYEFGRLSIANTVMSKRSFVELVNNEMVVGFDDPRLPTLVGLRRKGYTPRSLINFVLDTGLSRINSTTTMEHLEHFLREDLKHKVVRPHAIVDPLKVTITNYETGKIEYLDVINNSENPDLGSRQLPFSREIYIERSDFTNQPFDKSWKRFAKDLEVRLMHAYFIRCHEVIYDANGQIIELLCTYDPATKSGSGFKERKPNGNIHFVEATTALPATFNFFEPLLYEVSDDKKSLLERVNPNSWICTQGFVEPSLAKTVPGDQFQFVRNGYFAADKLSSKDKLVFNRICPLKSGI